MWSRKILRICICAHSPWMSFIVPKLFSIDECLVMNENLSYLDGVEPL